MNEHDWAKKYYQGAVGFTITAACMSADGFPVLICKRKQKGKKQETIRIEVSMDEEGNGAGFLFGLPVPE